MRCLHYLIYDKRDGCAVYTISYTIKGMGVLFTLSHIRRGILFTLLHLSQMRLIYEGGPFLRSCAYPKCDYYNYFHMDYIQSLRTERKLPDIVLQHNIYPMEYVGRFPAIIVAAPNFYPEPHPNTEYIFIGGHRKENDHNPLPQDLTEWINLVDSFSQRIFPV